MSINYSCIKVSTSFFLTSLLLCLSFSSFKFFVLFFQSSFFVSFSLTFLLPICLCWLLPSRTKHHRLTPCMERHSTGDTIPANLIVWNSVVEWWLRNFSGLQARSHFPKSDNPRSSHRNHTCECLSTHRAIWYRFKKSRWLGLWPYCMCPSWRTKELVSWRQRNVADF